LAFDCLAGAGFVATGFFAGVAGAADAGAVCAKTLAANRLENRATPRAFFITQNPFISKEKVIKLPQKIRGLWIISK
jgi:hypothetical protein